MMQALLRALQRVWIRHQLRNVAHAIVYEEREQRQAPLRVAHWYGERMKLLAMLRALEQPRARLGSNLMAGRPGR